MSINHHILAKNATDEVLSKFKSTEWKCAGSFGQDFYRVGTGADFPSPDAAFHDPTNKLMISFEFKPPTETKRGILTGVGQCIAYLQTSNISYLIAPKMLENFQIGRYLSDLFSNQISMSIPAGLIIYDNDDLNKMELVHDVDNLKPFKVKGKVRKVERFWAKWQDLPPPLFHLILHYYYLKRTNMIDEDPYAKCWREAMISPTVLEDFQTKPVHDIYGKPIMTETGNKQKVYLEKIIPALHKAHGDDIRSALAERIDTIGSGDNSYTGVKKYIVPFLRHMKSIDSESCLTEKGFFLYHLGLVNGPTSKIFIDYFTKELLTTGHHLDVILDFDKFRQNKSGSDLKEIIKAMEMDYESKGYIKRNPNSLVGDKSNTEFLKNEKIIWKALGLTDEEHNVQWRKITEICSLPDL